MGEGAAQVVIAVVLVLAALSPLALSVDEGAQALGPAPDAPDSVTDAAPEPFVEWKGGTGDPSNGSARRDPGSGGVASVDEEVRVVAKIRENAEVPDRVQQQYGDVYTREGARRLSGTVPLSEVRALSSAPGVEGVRIQAGPGDEHRSERRPPGVEDVGATELHRQGIEGDGVVVGIIDSGFRLSHPSIADQVGAFRSFSGRSSPAHGTAVASVVGDTAPGADLHLAAIGPSTSPGEYRAAVEWLRESGADVVVDAGSYFGQPGDGSGPIATAAGNASEDVVFVTSAGNYANRHWSGVHRPDNDSGYVDVAPGVEGNRLDGDGRVSGRVEAGLAWNGSGDYDLYLVRSTPAGDVVIASSETNGETDSEHLSTVVPEGNYYLAIHPNESAPPTGPVRLQLFASHDLRHEVSAGSVTAPASAEGVVAVGAYANGSVEPFSSRGPLADGRRGIDLVAPDGVRVDGVETGGGTSFAAPYVAGTVALLAAEFPSLSTGQLEDIVESNARDVGPDGPDPVTGYGVVDAVAAYEAAANATGDGEGSEGTAGDEEEEDDSAPPFPTGED